MMRISSMKLLLWLAQASFPARASTHALMPRASSTAAPTPLSVAPSQNWDGDDGPWSSFTIQVGTPVQDVRVFISSGNTATWVVLPAGCNAGDSNCLNNRGLTFNPNSSSTWSLYGNFPLNTEQNLNLSAPATFGNDTLGLGIQGSGGPVLQNQVIGGYTDTDFYLGFFGVNSADIDSTNTAHASYITTLKNQGVIPSSTFGYTAGNQYRLKQVLGSLTLGGYDSSRFAPNDLTLPFGGDSSRSLMVGIRSISFTDSERQTGNLLPNGIMSYVDSTVPQIWLPLEACQAFEKAFGLTFDETSELYLVNSSLHSQLQAQNASITFMLGNGTEGGQTTNITLPYASFDLLVQPPTPGVANSTRYFPLRRAANDSQYTLGRTFLQEAYLIVDWERQNFSISQCLFSDNSQENIVPIMPKSASSSSSSSSSTAKTAGIAVGVVLAILVVVGAIGVFFFCRHRRRSREMKAAKAKAKGEETPPDETIRRGFGKGELGTGQDNQRYEMSGSDPNQSKPHAPLGRWVDEKARYPGDRSEIPEVEGGSVTTSELPVQRAQRHGLHEMYDPSGPSAHPIELPADIPSRGELQGSNPTSAASSPRQKAIRLPVSAPGSPLSQSSKRRSLKDLFSFRPQPLRNSTQDSIPISPSAPSPAFKGSSGLSSPPSTEVFSPISRRGTDPIFSPVSPAERPRGMLECLRGPNRQD